MKNQRPPHFIDRERELSFLEEKWRDPRAQLIVLWGKRRIGKTELVKRFIADKPAAYFLAESTSDREQLARFSMALGRLFDEPLLRTRGFASWEETFAYLGARNERLVLAVDEFPYLAQSGPGIITLFQKGWDEHLANSRVYLVLLGSSMAMMETEVLGHGSPLFGRRTGQWLVEPMPFQAVSDFRRGKSFADRLAHFALAGGVPAYWLRLDPGKDIARNLRDHVLRKGEPLYDEVEFLLREELREPRFYFTLLQAIAQGKRKLGEIVNATGLGQSLANKYLGVLSDLRIVEREVPVTEEAPLKSKKGLYRICDEFCSFWFRFVLPRRSELELGGVDSVVGDVLRQLPQYLGGVYEKVAREALLAHGGMFFPFASVGRWWDRQSEIDIVALNPDRDSILFCEAESTGKPMSVAAYEALRAKAASVRWGTAARKESYCLFSRKGFTSSLAKRARAEGVALFIEDRPIEP